MQSPGTDSIASITGQQLVYGAEEGSTTEVNISVIVCTRNRGSVLDQCLQRFAWMEVPPGLSWEIVVVDNNSTDNTESVVRGFAERSGLDVRYVCERKPGGSHAHNAGIAAARAKSSRLPTMIAWSIRAGWGRSRRSLNPIPDLQG